jgi:ParB family chromosome partitioning protein
MAVKKRSGLGKGLDALLGKKDDVVITLADAKGDSSSELDIEKIQPGEYQPRTRMDKESLEELAQSIKEQGLISPILVRPIAKNRYEIIAGERRYQASKLAGLKKVPVLIRKISNEKALAWALIENIQREDLNPLEEAAGIQRLLDEFHMTHESASQAIGRSRTATTNLLRLLNLAQPVQDRLMANEISMGHARALLSLEPAMQVAIANEIVKKGLSVRQVETLVANMAQQKLKKGKVGKKTRKDADTLKLEEDLSNFFGATVKINTNQRGKGKLIIEFSNLDQFDGIIAHFGDFE